MCLAVANPYASAAAAGVGGHDNPAYHVDVNDSVSNHEESCNWNGNANAAAAGGCRHGGAGT